MVRVVAGVLQKIDRDRRQITIGSQIYEVLPAMGALDPELALGMSVTATVIDSDGAVRIAELKPINPPHYTAPR
jgi:hypothetical protein